MDEDAAVEGPGEPGWQAPNGLNCVTGAIG